MAETARVEEIEDARTPEETYRYWSAQLDLAEKEHRPFREAGDKVNKRYKAETDKVKRGPRLNILYSNTEHYRSALFGKSAIPDVRRRFGMEDKIGQIGAEVIEKALVYCQETYDSDRPLELAILDHLLPGRGVVRVEYEPVFGQDEQGQEIITDQTLKEVYVYWEDFLHSPARTWADIQKDGWISFRHTMSRENLRSNFPDVAKEVPLNWLPEMAERREIMDSLKKAEVFEIWNATDRKVYWIVKNFPKPLRVDDDPLGLEDFYPIAEPLQHYIGTDTFIPLPEFHSYVSQADQLDEITVRIDRLTKALKRRGIYDAAIKELSRLANAADNQFIPAENYASLQTKGGLAAAFQTEDISMIAGVLKELYTQRDQLVQQIWEICGIGDIQRGASNPNETLGAQQLKAQFGSQRLMRRQRQVQKWVRDILKLKAEIIAEHFEPHVLIQMTGIQINPQDPQQAQLYQQVFQMLRNDKMRGYRIDIETDSTVFEDAEAEKKSRSEMLGAVTQFMTGWGPIVQAQPNLAPVAFELLKFGLGSFKATRAIEDAIEEAATQFEQQAQQPKPPSPEEQQLQADQQKMQAEMQLKQADAQIKAQSEQQRLVFEQQKHEQEMAFKREEHEMNMQLEREKMQMEQITRAQDYEMRERDMEFKKEDAVLNRDIKYTEMAQSREMHDQTLEHSAAERETKDALERDKVGLPMNPTRKINDGLSSVLEAISKTSEALAMSAQETREAGMAQQQMAQAFSEGMEALVKHISAPRKRVAVRDPSGRMIEAHDVPMMQ